MKTSAIRTAIFVCGTVGVALLLITALNTIDVSTYVQPTSRNIADSPLAIDVGTTTYHEHVLQSFESAIVKFPEAGIPQIAGTPVHIAIPSIQVDASLESVGLTEKGDVGVPVGPTNPAWFNLGPRPGAVGNAVIVGHYGWKNNIPAVFDDLALLVKGDKLYVKDEHGVTNTFVVVRLQTYGANDTAKEVFVSSDGREHLNLITCSGIWNKKEKSYSTRLVVFTDKE